MTPNLADAAAFLAMLGTRHTFQCFDDSKAKRRVLSRVLHGTLEDHAETLAELNRRGAGIFVMANQGNGRGRKTEHVTGVRALFIDLDGAPLEPVTTATLAPHAIVETSSEKWHAYWLVADCPLAEFKPLQQALARRFNADAKVCDLPRVMRIPGFFHRKAEPFLSRIASLNKWAPRSLDEVRRGLIPDAHSEEPRKRRSLPAVISEGQRNATLFDAAAALVRRGHSPRGVNQRIQTINSERCSPPLSNSEVDTIASNATKYGSAGFICVPHALYDSKQWKALNPTAQAIVLEAFRRFDGSNNNRLSLTWADFEGREGFGKDRTFYRARAAAVDAGLLVQTADAAITQKGRKPCLFGISGQWLKVSLTPNLGASANAQIGRLK